MEFIVTDKRGVDYAGEHFARGSKVKILNAHVAADLLKQKRVDVVKDEKKETPAKP